MAGKRVEKPLAGCPKGTVLLRLRFDTNQKEPYYVRQGCSGPKPGADELALFEAVEQAAKP